MIDSSSSLLQSLALMSHRSGSAVVSRARIAHPALNTALLRRLSVAPGTTADALIADPVYEVAGSWLPGEKTLGELAGDLLSVDLVAALDGAGTHAMARDLRPYAHQIEAWQASLGQGRSTLVTSGTGSGKTECFLIPILDDLLTRTRPGGGVQAILLYPLNALIESQRERLAAWAEGLGGRVRFALFNGDTPETEFKASVKSSNVELRSRAAIRSRPPEILVTNVTMLEYLLLRAQDRPLLEASQGALRWIVLDEAHSYIGSQAAEMALLLRRVRAAFGVSAADVRLMATSATIGGEDDSRARLTAFLAALAGQPEDRVAVIEGRTQEPDMPDQGPDRPLHPEALAEQTPTALWSALADHPRLQDLRRRMARGAVSLGRVATVLFDDPTRREAAQWVLDAAARASDGDRALLPWRAHLFHRAQGGGWVCIDPDCPHRDPELRADDADWPYGAVWLAPRARCDCGAPVLELVACTECGTPHLEARLIGGAHPRIEPSLAEAGDDFGLDAEPSDDEPIEVPTGCAWLVASSSDTVWIGADDGRVFDNRPPEGQRAFRLRLFEDPGQRGCCEAAHRVRLMGLHFGPAFFLGASLPQLVEDLAPPMGRVGLPAGGRRAISFSDSRQGVARLAAKLQQDGERTLTRAFLWHAVQQDRGRPDSDKIDKLQTRLAKFRRDPEEWAEEITEAEADLADMNATGSGRPIPWPDLVQGLARQSELRDFAGEIWRPRQWGGREMAEDPAKLAEMFLYRELLRRPKVQNNPETMGLLRLSFPRLEEKARAMRLPDPLIAAGADHAAWTGLALAAVDYVFRDRRAVVLSHDFMAEWVFPRQSGRHSVHAAGVRRDGATDQGATFWPDPLRSTARLVRHVHALINGNPSLPVDQDRAGEVLDALWHLITSTVAPDQGQGAHRLDFAQAGVVRLDQGWLCPVTRRPFGYSVAGRSPHDPDRVAEPVDFPRLPEANPGGLLPEARARITNWATGDEIVAHLRHRGLWSNLHDRIAAYPPFLRAQEHSAQLDRAVLKHYEQEFHDGKINLLNCSTTMEMGVDIPKVQLVVNANVPPSLSNYRQRVGRAGRRGEPWAFGVTFCRNLPLDLQAFEKPASFLARPIVAPRVWFDSPALVARHVNAALLAAWLAERGGVSVLASMGGFLGAGETPAEAVLPGAPADGFADDLRGEWGAAMAASPLLAGLVVGTVLETRAADVLLARTERAMARLAERWRIEYRALLDRQQATDDRDSAKAFELRAARMHGERLLGELARRGFTPSYGFPTDVVSFDTLSTPGKPAPQSRPWSFDKRGGASRQLDIAIREYAPGAEVVMDGLVHQSEGIRPAWDANADASRLEDFQTLWSCPECHGFGMSKLDPDTCPQCGNQQLLTRKTLRPVGFVGRKRPHTGYENLTHIPFEMPMLSAQGADWVALPDPGAGRLRHDAEGQVVTTSGGALGGGYALCLDCGRAEAMPPGDGITRTELPGAIRRHRPLVPGKSAQLERTGGYCRGGLIDPQRVQRHVHLAHATHTDVFEMQLPVATTAAAGLALAAALREALSARLGVEPREIGPATAASQGPAGEPRVSLFLHDRAAGGAGLVARMAEPEVLATVLAQAETLLDCAEDCDHGCPACILRPDLNQRDIRLDRRAGLALCQELRCLLVLPDRLKVFGPDSRPLGRDAIGWITHMHRAGSLRGVDLYLHRDPGDWDFGGWRLPTLASRLAGAGVRVRLVLAQGALTRAGFDLGTRLGLYRLAGECDLSLIRTLPMAGGMPVVARIDRDGATEMLVAPDLESTPGSDWASGADSPLVVGPAQPLDTLNPFSADQLMNLSTGTARVLWPELRLDGALKGFGARFWKVLHAAAPLDIAAFKTEGIARIDYSDRYLLTPLNLALLAKIIGSAPGAAEAAVAVQIAPADRVRPGGWAVFHDFPTDADRRAVLRALLPEAQVDMATRKNNLTHHRQLMVTLKDGRRWRLLMDQGLGAWRAEGNNRHDFNADPATQGRVLQRAAVTITIDNARSAPMTMEWVA